MTFPFMIRNRRPRVITDVAAPIASAHRIESDFSKARCRFILECSCGTVFDTPYIDEALEWRELHELLAPLADQLPR